MNQGDDQTAKKKHGLDKREANLKVQEIGLVSQGLGTAWTWTSARAPYFIVGVATGLVFHLLLPRLLKKKGRNESKA